MDSHRVQRRKDLSRDKIFVKHSFRTIGCQIPPFVQFDRPVCSHLSHFCWRRKSMTRNWQIVLRWCPWFGCFQCSSWFFIVRHQNQEKTNVSIWAFMSSKCASVQNNWIAQQQFTFDEICIQKMCQTWSCLCTNQWVCKNRRKKGMTVLSLVQPVGGTNKVGGGFVGLPTWDASPVLPCAIVLWASSSQRERSRMLFVFLSRHFCHFDLPSLSFCILSVLATNLH